ncbi:undecaprenyl-diphosphatase [Candidatus Collierbacteria bacterium CG10_big_fil_rev_8_21_14_0_10_43_36]|uniref:Undecaprenyl-diphosphatase n=3 Tax=Candidatus Collieribacteriota TaxID=1752725 RepID=A0A2H0DTT9_9BACT|nr:undecaprenyl-diphosphate phosphatase [bacterium]PIP85491.1 MAG: undecaprenyl-diphosphatase [Candidatus Collierbacteria bacterium CG22_combo_CG10-13_8_21_14_all_43_12]PIR99728.1 MAG: undecaprenyl-diphosphatase [Candidatus Collierbacteria bacterium CG10_big_fil_rev_8_21_14_0_10_43_36]PIZ24686.1 MAG: undecaprenyl-diphosphatase [Candidatus Collierbacteria bacterium CG_4_10_14_0_8_um_filter_43_86]PJB48619.1 MAG: undecaprenyl-diphosphatase [Candidatus Collierbacteria bacterium CG_4_9_14_3_um_filte
MTIFQAIILSIVEGLTEFLPISSTGHLIIVQKYLFITTSEFTKTFDIVVQLSAIMAVVWLYRKILFSQVTIWKQSLIAFIPTGIIGFLLYKLIRNTLLGNPLITIYALFFGGIILLVVDKSRRLNSGQKKHSHLSLKQLFYIGFFQSISVIPGVSRSAAAIVGGLGTGISRSQAVEFSFFLAIPTMLAATGYDLLKSGLAFSDQEYSLLLIGSFFSFFSAIISVKLFIEYIQKNNFTPFAIYRIVLALVVLLTMKV